MLNEIDMSLVVFESAAKLSNWRKLKGPLTIADKGNGGNRQSCKMAKQTVKCQLH